jgi:hypothetical protein
MDINNNAMMKDKVKEWENRHKSVMLTHKESRIQKGKDNRDKQLSIMADYVDEVNGIVSKKK